MSEQELVFHVAQLDAGFRRVEGGIRCRWCGRGWRVPESGGLNRANFLFLHDHAADHTLPAEGANGRERNA